MKLPDLSWRSRIGGFAGGSFRKRSPRFKSSVYLLSACYVLAVINVLLLVGNVEANPGPESPSGSSNADHDQDKSVDNVPVENIMELYKRLLEENPKFTRPYRMPTSIFGVIAERLGVKNDFNVREKLHEICQMPQEQLDAFNRTRKKRKYRKMFYEKEIAAPIGTQEITKNIEPPAQDRIPSKQVKEAEPHDLAVAFQRAVSIYTNHSCDVCDKLMYHFDTKKFKMSSQAKAAFQLLGKSYAIDEILRVCIRCHTNLSNNKCKIPSKAVSNKMSLLPIPNEIETLSSAEIRLLCQVKVYMKIYLLCKGRGQKAIKGMTIHFPQSVNEVTEQLPRTSSEADFVVVHESIDGVEGTRDLEIRPNNVYKALDWLCKNNILYKHVKIVHENIGSLTSIIIQGNDDCAQPEEDYHDHLGYDSLGTGAEILHGTFNQSSAIFSEVNRGRQCTAMASAFIAFASTQSPATWTKQTVDEILLCGDRYYTKCRLTCAEPLLEAGDVTGIVENCFGSVSIRVEANVITSFSGYFTKAKVRGSKQLPDSLKEFIDQTEYNHAIITTGSGFSMGIVKESSHLYYFDSHSRGKAGRPSSSGTAVILKYNLETAPKLLSTLIHYSSQPNNPPRSDSLADNMPFSYTIIPFSVQPSIQSRNPSPVQDSPDMLNSPRPKCAKTTEDIDDLSSLGTGESVAPDLHPSMIQFAQDLPVSGATDCVIDADDFVEPRIENVLDKNGIELKRTAGKPLNSNIEKNLDLLAFPHLFPTGVNGVNEERIMKISTTDYYQQRLMSADKRFAGNIEYLFYALSECDKQRVQQKISVCCSMKNQDGDSQQGENFLSNLCDPHLYMSAIRGSASYWKKYTGDIIAMIKSLGIPTFFLTFSFDELNSLDCLNVLWKAEHGPEASIDDCTSVPYETRQELLRKYPIPAARHFCVRLNKFLALLQSKSTEIFGAPLLDFTIRVEFQARGSPHAHCLLWLDFSHSWNSAEGKAFIERNISCSLAGENKDLVLKYQNHRHTATCFKGQRKLCRFNFPRKLSSETVVLRDEHIHKNGGRFVDLKRQSNEVMINNYNMTLLQILRCNMDIQPVTGAMAVAYYIAKYIAKSEPAEIRQEIHDSIETIKGSGIPTRQKMNKIAMKLMRSREISAQEAAFRLCHLFLRQSSRACVFLPTFRKEKRIRMVRKETIAQDNPEFCYNIIDRYMSRPTSLERLCLYEFAAEYTPMTKPQIEEMDADLIEGVDEDENELENLPTIGLQNNMGRMKKRNRAAVIKHPNFDFTTDKESYYYSLLLMYLPFREENFADTRNPSEVFQEKREDFRSNAHNSIIRVELATELDQALLRMADYAADHRDPLDIENEFTMSFEANDEPLTANETFHIPNVVDDIQNDFDTLSDDQKNVFLRIDGDLKSHTKPLRLIVSGEGGCGKSYLIRVVSKLIRNFHTSDSLVIAAPTGVAAFNINGLTIHRAFALGVELDHTAKYNKLGARKLQELRRVYRNLKYVILDEMSMINYQTFRAVHLRLCDIFSTDEPFGGKNIIVLGDLMQIKPPMGSWIFNLPAYMKSETNLWKLFDFAELTTNHRQADTDPLLGICNRLRVGELSQEDLESLYSRLLDPAKPNYEEMNKEFKDATWVFPILEQVKRHNQKKSTELCEKLKAEGKPMFNLIAKDTYADGLKFGQVIPDSLAHSNEKKCGGMPKTLQLGEGSRVMLRRNICVKDGLVNGALGVVVGFKWPALRRTQQYHGELPEEVHVKFDHSEAIHKISIKTVDFFGRKHTRITRSTIPLVLAWGINIHKMQGLTVSKIVVDLGKHLFEKGMAYVALSRVKTLNGLAISTIQSSKLIRTSTFTPCDEQAMAELKRLRENAGNSTQNN